MPMNISSIARYGLLPALLGWSLSVGASLPAMLDGRPMPSLAPMLADAMPAVVNISTRAHVRQSSSPLMEHPFFRQFFDLPKQRQSKRPHSLGSGVVVDAERGYILTNAHVVEGADEISVTLTDGRELEAERLGEDPDTDVALIQVPADGLQAIPFADSDQLRVGDFVVAIGNPFGLGQTATSGIVSALGRSGLGIEGYEDFIQTDASINPGNSGGALVNLRGELIGVNTAILAPNGGNIGIGFAIPSNMLKQVMQHLVAHGEVRRGLLGIAAQDLTPALAAAFGLDNRQGAVVVSVDEGSAAEDQNVQPGDIVLAINGREVRNSTDLRNQVGLLAVGDSVRLETLRAGQPRRVDLVIEDLQLLEAEGSQFHRRLSGALFREVEVKGGGGAENPKVILVASVTPDSQAYRSGLREGDLITGVNRTRITDMKLFHKLVLRHANDLTLHMQRDNASVYLIIR